MRVIVTRPIAQAAEWVEILCEQGVDAAALPLIAITAAPDPTAVAAAWATLGLRRLVVFVSPNAVQAFFDLAPVGAAWPVHLRAASPGPGTTHLLARLGVAPQQIIEPAVDAPQFDSEALWARLAADDWHGASVLIVRGTSGRDWLAMHLRERGAHVDHVAAYARAAPVFSVAEQQLFDTAMAEPRQHLWLFSSSEAIVHLAAFAAAAAPAGLTASVAPADLADLAVLAPPATLAAPPPAPGANPWREARAVATHPRIAARAQRLGFGHVTLCRPTLAAVVACIQSLRP